MYELNDGETEKLVFVPPYEMVDLGLNVKWANMNLGAKNITDSGLYFQWGDTGGYKATQASVTPDYSKYYDSSTQTYTKYNSTDKLTTLEASDDAATVNMGSKWRMPTKEEFLELIEGTNYEAVTINGIDGIRFISKSNNNWIFIPLTYEIHSQKFSTERQEMCMTSSLSDEADWIWCACYDDLKNHTFKLEEFKRHYFYTIRAVENKTVS